VQPAAAHGASPEFSARASSKQAPPIERARDYLPLAQARLDATTWHYLQDGDSPANAQALSSVPLMPRPLRALVGGHTRTTLFGQALAHPIMLAPIAYQRLFHPDGEVASAMAAAAQGGQMVISSLASQPIEAIVRASLDTGGAAPWFQLYWQQDRPRTLSLLRRAEAAGCSAVVFTVDAPVKRATLQLPPGVQAVNLAPPLPLALPPATAQAQASVVFDGWMAQAPTWDDLAWLRQSTRLPLIVKGLLHPDDAAQAIDLGCDGLVVSNHGGRVLEGAPSSLSALAPIVQRVQGRVPVLFDSGVRSGRDAFVALAQGAAAVLLGRPAIWGLAANGALGVAHTLRLMRDELEMTMALTGCATLADILRSVPPDQPS
jgi:4-hydroxymandelate oxidase